MHRSASLALGLGLVAVACATATTATPRTQWRALMHEVDTQWQFVDTELRRPSTDLEAVARAARSAADLVRQGYGAHEQKDIAGFARLARDCESWLLALALEADQGHGELARELATAERCTACHDRSGRRR